MVDIEALAKDPSHRTLLLDRAMRTHDMDNERFLRKVRERLDRCLIVKLLHRTKTNAQSHNLLWRLPLRRRLLTSWVQPDSL